MQELDNIFHVYLNICPNCDKIFAVISRKYKKLAISDILRTITMGVNMITRHKTPLFLSIL